MTKKLRRGTGLGAATGQNASGRVTVVLAVFLLALAGIVVTTSDSSFAVAKIDPSVNAATIDASRRGSLTIEKSSGDPLTQYGDPTNPSARTDRSPLTNLEFTIRRIENADLTTNTGWRVLTKANVSNFYEGGASRDQLGAPTTARTDSSGKARFDDLPVGAYFVEESPHAAELNNVSLISPFIVTIPRTNPGRRSEWLYDVTVAAKDQVLEATKTASKTCVKGGGELQFGISSTIPAPDSRGRIPRLEIADPLPVGVTQVDNTDRIVVSTGRVGKAPTEFSIPRDATISVEHTPNSGANDPEDADDREVVRMTLTPSGLHRLAKLRSGRPDTEVTWIFDVRVPATQGSIYLDNRAFSLHGGYPEFDMGTKPGVPTNKVRVKVNDCPPGEATVPIPIPIPNPDLSPGDDNNPGTPPVPGGDRDSHQPYPDSEPPADMAGGRSGGLAMTGANVLWLLVAGGALVALGAGLMRLRRSHS